MPLKITIIISSFFSDSLSALQLLQSPKINIKLNNYILEIITKYNKFVRETPNGSILKFVWIPAHVGIRRNEEADHLAKNTTKTNSIDIVNIPFTDLYRTFKQIATNQTLNIIKNQGQLKGVSFFKHYHNEKRAPWYSHTTLSRKLIVTINRLRSNHYNLSASLGRIGIINNANFNCNEEHETDNHELWQCQLYDTQRIKLITNLAKEKIRLPLSIESLIAEPIIRAAKCIMSFLKDCNLSI